MPAHTRMTSS